MAPSSRSQPWRPPSRRVFETWLEEMEPAINGWIHWGLPVDFDAPHRTRAALVEVQRVIRDRFPRGAEDVLAPDADRRWIDGAVRYIGQTLVQSFGGRWHYDPSPEALDPGRPIIVIAGRQGPEPISVFGLVVSAAAEPYGSAAALTDAYDRLAAEA